MARRKIIQKGGAKFKNIDIEKASLGADNITKNNLNNPWFEKQVL